MKKMLALSVSLLILALAACSALPGASTPTPSAPAPSGVTATLPVSGSATAAPTQSGGLPAQATTAAASPEITATATLALQVSAMPDPAQVYWQPVVSGLSQPVYVTGAGDGSGRLWVAQQSGQIQVLSGGQLAAEPFLDISDRISRPSGERGLLGLAFHPAYAQNGYFYLNYTDRDGNTVISRFQVSSNDPNRADPASELPLLNVEQPYPNHNGGMIGFGPDGLLYIGLGDGGSAGDPENRAQSPEALLGKILRLDVDRGDPYAIPADNPFANGGGEPEIWALGLRNPWRFSFDSLTQDLYIGDVGQNKWEEINFLPAGSPAGANFGWKIREGTHAYEGSAPAGAALRDPVTEYSHNLGCSVSGGVVYRGTNLPQWWGVYLYGDYCSGRIWGLLRNPDGSWQQAMLFESGLTIPSFGTDDAGEVYVIDYSAGVLYRLAEK